MPKEAGIRVVARIAVVAAVEKAVDGAPRSTTEYQAASTTGSQEARVNQIVKDERRAKIMCRSL